MLEHMSLFPRCTEEAFPQPSGRAAGRGVDRSHAQARFGFGEAAVPPAESALELIPRQVEEGL